MPSYRTFASLGVIIVSVTTPLAQRNPSFLNWSAEISAIGGGDRVMRLLNLTSNKFLREGNGTSQPNLSLIAGSTIVNVSFATQEFGSSEVRLNRAVLGQTMALKVSKDFVYVEKTPKGPVLRTGPVPKFEWIAIGVGNIGIEPTSRQAIGLLSTRARDFLVFQEKGGGSLPLGWDKDDKRGAYLRGPIFVRELRKRGFASMADLLKRAMGW